MKWIQKGLVQGISLKLQEEECEGRMDFVPDISAIKTDEIKVDKETTDILTALSMMDLPRVREDESVVVPVLTAPFGYWDGGPCRSINLRTDQIPLEPRRDVSVHEPIELMCSKRSGSDFSD
ncbi:small ribosomal subunit protein eS17-like [Malania oleifera]|uniref:small ribosomal subunit protein eS17-like n=1 Tax=Malania oleifera TaxID=397392 RepID=UPI0025AE9DA1|nr:small ribosomal subunit protein eS17-like [Malania oleifera]